MSNETSILDARIGYLRMVREVKRLGDEYSILQPNTSFKYPLLFLLFKERKVTNLIKSFVRLIDYEFVRKFMKGWINSATVLLLEPMRFSGSLASKSVMSLDSLIH